MAITKLRVRGRAGLLGLIFGKVEPAFGAKARFLFVLLAATGTAHGSYFSGNFILAMTVLPRPFSLATDWIVQRSVRLSPSTTLPL